MEISPKIMYVRISENCNSHCFMCHYAGTTNSYNITIEQYKDLLEHMKKYDYKVIRFTGGEPLLHKDLFTFINLAKQNGLKTSIITNGFLLDRYAKKLVDSGLDQCIISLDGSCSDVHDELRNFKGCFNNIISGIKKLRFYHNDMFIRVNTVVSGKNIHDICNIYKLLVSLCIDQWSIIPVKYKENLWTVDSLKYYEEFQELVKDVDYPLFLGNSKHFAGKTPNEIKLTFNNQSLIKSKNQCSVVDYVRFYIPDKNLLVPCNCISHRLHQIPFELNNNMEECCEKIRIWLKENSSNCTGCEPLNAYINDNPKIMLEDDIKY